MGRFKYFLLVLLIAGYFVISCSPQDEQLSVITATAVVKTPQEFVGNSSDVYKIEGWQLDSPVNNGKAIVFWGSIFRNGTILSGMPMHATWPDSTAERGIAQCDVQVGYGRGMCTIFTDHFTPGEFVPVSLKFEYNGKYYYGEFGFTP